MGSTHKHCRTRGCVPQSKDTPQHIRADLECCLWNISVSDCLELQLKATAQFYHKKYHEPVWDHEPFAHGFEKKLRECDPTLGLEENIVKSSQCFYYIIMALKPVGLVMNLQAC